VEKSASIDLAGGFSDLEMTWLLYCFGAATVLSRARKPVCFSCQPGWLAITGQKLSVCVCVCVKSELIHLETCNRACADPLMNSDHKPETRSD